MNKIAGKFPEPATEYFYIKWSQEMFGVNSLLTGKKKKKILMSFCKQFSLLINSVASLEFFFPSITSCVIRPLLFVSWYC